MIRREPLVSIALCTYNGEQFLREQLESILAQTYSNLEIIVVDDCSTDDTYNILLQYAEKDNRVKVYANERNLGFNKNFEKAIRLTTGKYVSISDQDDIWLPEKISTLKENIGDKWLIFSNSIFINTKGEDTDLKLFYNLNLDQQDYKNILLNNFVTGHTTLCSRELLKYCFPLPQKAYYDWYMGFIALYHHKITWTTSILTKYRIHPHSVIQTAKQRYNEGDYNSDVISLLTACLAYSNLSVEDRDFIAELRLGLQEREKRFSVRLFKLVARHYPAFFSNCSQRNGFSRLNFARKFAKRLKS